MYHGIINVYKEKGFTSHDVVAKLRGICKQKKIGHTGTLDPMAEGVLLVCLGKATKLVDLLTEGDKCYRATMKLGYETDTEDVTGETTAEGDAAVLAQLTQADVKRAILSFIGKYDQIPPMYSALKVNGKKLCDLARAGVTVERQARPVQLYSIEIIKMELPRVCMRVRCSKGTYIRTLCQDIGEKLSCGACMESLLRTKVSEFCVQDALRLSEIEERVQKAAGQTPSEQWNAEMFDFIYAVDSVFLQYKKAVICKEWNKLLYNGNRMKKDMFVSYQKDWEQQKVRIYDEEGRFIGIYEYSEIHGDYKPVKLFMEA